MTPENDEQFNLFSRLIANALGQRRRVPAEPPAMFRNEKHEDIRMWLLTCMIILVEKAGRGK